MEEKLKKEIFKATNEKYWRKFRYFNVFHSLRGLPERIMVCPAAFGYPHNMNPYAFAKFPFRRNNEDDIKLALCYFSRYC